MREVHIFFESMTASDSCLGRIGEHRATKLILHPPEWMVNDDRTAFYIAEIKCGETLYLSQEEIDAPLEIELVNDMTKERKVTLQVLAYDDNGDYIGKSNVFGGFYLDKSISGDPIVAGDGTPDLAHQLFAGIEAANAAAQNAQEKAAAAETAAEEATAAAEAVDDKIAEAMEPYSTTAELEPMLIYSGTVGSGTASGDATVFTASVSGLKDSDVTDGTKLMLHAQIGSGGDLETVRKLRIGAAGVERLLYMAQERPASCITYPWSEGAALLLTAVTVDNECAWRVDMIYQRASDEHYGIVKVQDTIDGMKAATGTAASPFGVQSAIANAAPAPTRIGYYMGSETRGGKIVPVWLPFPEPEEYELPAATADTLGGVKVAATNTVIADENGRLEVNLFPVDWKAVGALLIASLFDHGDGVELLIDNGKYSDEELQRLFEDKNMMLIDGNSTSFLFVPARNGYLTLLDENYDEHRQYISKSVLLLLQMQNGVLTQRLCTGESLRQLLVNGL